MKDEKLTKVLQQLHFTLVYQIYLKPYPFYLKSKVLRDDFIIIYLIFTFYILIMFILNK